MIDKKDISDERLDTLMKKLRKVWNEREFLYGICFLLGNDSNADLMIQYLDDNPDVDSTSVFEKCFEIIDADIYA